MNWVKAILIGFLLVLAAVGGLVLFSAVAWLIKMLFFVGVLGLVGVVAYKALQSKSRTQITGGNADDEPVQIADSRSAEKLLEEYKRRD